MGNSPEDATTHSLICKKRTLKRVTLYNRTREYDINCMTSIIKLQPICCDQKTQSQTAGFTTD